MPHKTGRKPKPYVCPWNHEPIHGLYQIPGGNRWRIVETGERFTEDDPRLAVARFRAWQASQVSIGDITAGITAASPGELEALVLGQSPEESPGAAPDITVRVHAGGVVTVTDSSLRPEQWGWLREQILGRPQWVAQMVGIEQIAYLQDLKKPTPSPTLAEVGKLYFDHRGPKMSVDWRSKTRQFWREFCQAVAVTTLGEVEQAHIVSYADGVLEASDRATYSRQRFGAIKAILNFPAKRGVWAADCARVLTLCTVLVPRVRAGTDPQPIAPADYRRLLDHADDTMRAVLLLALNGCMYAREVAAVNWSELDLQRGTLVTSRHKTKVVRVATLWPATVQALEALPRVRADAVFVTELGTQANYLPIYRRFKAVRAAAGLESVQFSQIRDGAYTAAVEAGVDLNLCKLLAGHAVGIADHYVKRRPAMVAAACEAIRLAYLGD